MSEEVEREVERLAELLIPYICERTGFSGEDVEAVMTAQEDFWDHQPNVIGRLFVLGFEIGGDDDG